MTFFEDFSELAWRTLFERLIITQADLTYAARFLKEYLAESLYRLEGPPRSIFADALTLAIAVTYARPFTAMRDRYGRGESFDTSFLTATLSLQQRGLHARLLSDRHKIYAHSDARPKDARVHDTSNRITTSYDFTALEKWEAEELLAVVEQMQAALKPRLEQLHAAIPPDS